MPRQIPTALALFFVVAFGSSLDVAAIQQDSPEPLDYNRELVTVGQYITAEFDSVPASMSAACLDYAMKSLQYSMP